MLSCQGFAVVKSPWELMAAGLGLPCLAPRLAGGGWIAWIVWQPGALRWAPFITNLNLTSLCWMFMMFMQLMKQTNDWTETWCSAEVCLAVKRRWLESSDDQSIDIPVARPTNWPCTCRSKSANGGGLFSEGTKKDTHLAGANSTLKLRSKYDQHRL